jgi:hypothetical protein
MLVEDLKQTFENLNKWKWKLNLNKCVFGIPSGQLLGFLVSIEEEKQVLSRFEP